MTHNHHSRTAFFRVRDSTFEELARRFNCFVPSEGGAARYGPAIRVTDGRATLGRPVRSLASAAMTAADDATLKDGDLNQRAMPNLDQGDVDALAAAVAPMLAEDDALRAWCSASPAIDGRRASVGTLLRRSS